MIVAVLAGREPAARSSLHRGYVDALRAAVVVVPGPPTEPERALEALADADVLLLSGGGDLVQDLPAAGLTGHWRLDDQYVPVHAITAEAGSAACAVLGGADRVNSIHHQAVGLQWHPERLVAGDPRHLAPFCWLAGSRVAA